MNKRERNTARALSAAVILLAGIFLSLLIFNALPAQRVKRQLSLGQKYLDEQNYDQAVLAFEAAIKIDPKKQESHALLGNAYRGMAEQLPESQYEQKKMAYEQAADAYRDAQVLIPENADTYNQLITVYEELILLTEVQEPEKADEYQELKTEAENNAAVPVPTVMPVMKIPVTETPVTEIPVTEVPTKKSSVPVTEMPATGTSAAEVQATDTLTTEVTVTETPVTDVPVTESPEPEPTGTEEDYNSEASEAPSSDSPAEVSAEYTLTQPDLILSQETLDIVTLITGAPRADKDCYHLQYVYAPQKSRGIGITGETRTWLLSACQYDFDGNGREDIFAVLFEGAGTVQEDNNLVFVMLENDDDTGVWKERKSIGLELPIVEMTGEQNVYIGRLEDGSAVILTEDNTDGVVNISGHVYANGEFQTWNALQDHENNSILDSAICILRCSLIPESGSVFTAATDNLQEWSSLDSIEMFWSDMTGVNVPQTQQEEETAESASDAHTEEGDFGISSDTGASTHEESDAIAGQLLPYPKAETDSYDFRYVRDSKRERGMSVTGVRESQILMTDMYDYDQDGENEILAIVLEGAGSDQEENNLILFMLEQDADGWKTGEKLSLDFPISADNARTDIFRKTSEHGDTVIYVESCYSYGAVMWQLDTFVYRGAFERNNDPIREGTQNAPEISFMTMGDYSQSPYPVDDSMQELNAAIIQRIYDTGIFPNRLGYDFPVIDSDTETVGLLRVRQYPVALTDYYYSDPEQFAEGDTLDEVQAVIEVLAADNYTAANAEDITPPEDPAANPYSTILNEYQSYYSGEPYSFSGYYWTYTGGDFDPAIRDEMMGEPQNNGPVSYKMYDINHDGRDECLIGPDIWSLTTEGQPWLAVGWPYHTFQYSFTETGYIIESLRDGVQYRGISVYSWLDDRLELAASYMWDGATLLYTSTESGEVLTEQDFTERYGAVVDSDMITEQVW